jgi:CheY-like chemotaxis protein
LGLGLSIVWQLVGLHGGTVEAQSEGEGKGSTFVVRLPITATPQSEEDHDTRSATNGNNSPLKETATNGAGPNGAIPDGLTRLDNIRVLVVEDEDDAREVLRALFQHCGSEIMVAASAAEALRVLETWQPDVLVSDIGLPDEDGYSLIRKIRALETSRGSELPAIALTAFAKSADRERALQAGFQVHVSKPVEPAELTAVVARLVVNRSTPA